MFIELHEHDSGWRDIYKLAISFIQPRPIALVSSLSAAGVPNLAQYSFYNMVSANPPVIMFAPTLRRDGGGKDSLQNVEATGEFVVATVTEVIVARVNQCAYEYPPDVDEFARAGLTPRPARLVKPALVEESPVNIECALIDIRRFGEQPGAGSVVFGRVVAIHVQDDVLVADGVVDPEKLAAIGRMGGSTYVKTSGRFDIPRPEEP